MLTAVWACAPRNNGGGNYSVYYPVNIKSKVFHKPSHKYRYGDTYTSRFHYRGGAIAAGYRPCKACKP